MPTRAELEAEVRRHPDDARAHLALGRQLEREDLHGQAASSYQQALSLDDQQAEAAFRLGMLLMLQDRGQDALPLLVHAVNLDQANGIYWSNLGLLLLLLGHLEEALDAFLASWETAPELEQTPLHIARLYIDLGSPEEIADWDGELERLGDRYPEAGILRIAFYLSLQSLDEALSIGTDLITRFPENADVLATVGNLYIIQEDQPTAYRLFEQAIGLAPDHYDALVGLAGMLGQMGQMARAKAVYQRSISKDAERYQAYVGLCLLAFQDDDPMELAHWNEAGLAKAPNQPDLLFFKAKLLARADQPAAAAALLNQLLEINPIHHQAHFELANLYYLDLHDPERSRGHLQVVLDLVPGSAIAKIATEMLARL
jgi:tetratricopeptide (TPR) repeat protein